MSMKYFLIRISIGAALGLAGLALIWAGYNAAFMVLAGVTAIAVAGLIRWRSGDQPETDERGWKIWAFAMAYSWLVSIVFVSILLGGGYLGLLDLSTGPALEAAAWVMSVSALLFLAYFNRRGDVGIA
ncbi:MAG: hypothetical protein A4E47_01014 [Methanosaeta sp. PtaU1.Bin028]|nr:MAG: hypothetical protein A4E47_01014 [Methanosaeta sp. PtaU1.Bin028]